MVYLPTLISIIEVLLLCVPVLLTVAYVTVAERKTMASMQRRIGPNAVGYYGLLQAFADALKLLLKEYVSPTQANLVLFFLGPIITLIFSLLGYMVIPYGPGLALNDLNLGILYMLAVSSLSTYGILLAGWSANSKYAFLGSLRSTAQLISYELILTSAILLVIILTGSLNVTVNIEAQRTIWFIIPLFPIFIIFFIGSIAETNRPPFDLAEAESGVYVNFYGIKYFFVGIVNHSIIYSIYRGIIFWSKHLNFSYFFSVVCNRLIVGSIILLLGCSFALPLDEMLLLNILIVIVCFIFYLEKEYYIKKSIKNLKILYIQDKYFFLTICCVSWVFMMVFIYILTLLIVKLDNSYLLYLLPVLSANFFYLIEGLDFVSYGNQVLIGDNTNINVGGTSSNEAVSNNLSSSSPRGNGQSPPPTMEPANIIGERPGAMQALVKRKLELQAQEPYVNDRGNRNLRPIFSTDFSNGARLNQIEQGFIIDHIAARPESGYSPHTSFPNTPREKVIIQRGFGRGSFHPQAKATQDFINLF